MKRVRLFIERDLWNSFSNNTNTIVSKKVSKKIVLNRKINFINQIQDAIREYEFPDDEWDREDYYPEEDL